MGMKRTIYLDAAAVPQLCSSQNTNERSIKWMS